MPSSCCTAHGRERGGLSRAPSDSYNLSDERTVYFTWERLPPAPRVFREVQARRRVTDKRFVCLHRDDNEPTNTGSERDLRNSVVHDTVTGG